MNKKQITEITSNNVPDDTISLVTYMPYNDDIDYKGVKFYKLGTCSKTCQNKGIFAKNDLDNMLIHGYNSCPLCKEPYDITNIPTKPPFGIMSYGVYNDGKIKWHNIHFDLYYDKYKRTQNAYYPICDEGDLALWLICEAWKNGKLFTMGTSVSTGIYGIVFNGIHLRTLMSGGITNHGYSSNPKQDMKNILTNLINECNAFNIFTPSQLDDFAGIDSKDTSPTMSKEKASRLIKQLLLQRQTNLSELRKQHKQRLINLSHVDYDYFKEYVWGVLMNVVLWKTITEDLKTKLLNNQTIKIQFNKKNVDYVENKWRLEGVTRRQELHSLCTTKNILPKYIVNMSKVILEFPRTTKPFYVYRGVYMNTKSPSQPHYSINPVPFSTSLHAWFALSFAHLKNEMCCLYRIKVDSNVPCVILSNTPYDVIKQSQKTAFIMKEKGNVGMGDQYEVLLAPGILKEKSRKITHKITDKQEYDKLNEALKYNNEKSYLTNPPSMKQSGVLMIDVEYIPLYPSLIDNKNKYEIKTSRLR